MVRAADTPKYATKQIRREETIPMGMALWGFFTSSPVIWNRIFIETVLS